MKFAGATTNVIRHGNMLFSAPINIVFWTLKRTNCKNGRLFQPLNFSDYRLHDIIYDVKRTCMRVAENHFIEK